jgi:hypothetical protein
MKFAAIWHDVEVEVVEVELAEELVEVDTELVWVVLVEVEVVVAVGADEDEEELEPLGALVETELVDEEDTRLDGEEVDCTVDVEEMLDDGTLPEPDAR